MTQGFYRAFEDKHRGSRELIKSRLSVYLPFIECLSNLYPKIKVVDLGCGRGEWLELLSHVDVDAHGVDIDENMLFACRVLNLNVANADALLTLKKMQKESAGCITGFHVAEHLEFHVLQEIVKESLQILVPGGLLILETPNPENTVVGACNFYTDPTHDKPLPPSLLAFLPEYYGYRRVKILRLQESENIKNNTELSLSDVLSGASPDYSIIAQKTADNNVLAKFDDLFAKQYGVSTSELADKYDSSMAMKDKYRFQKYLEQAEFMARQIEINIQQANDQAQQAKVLVQQSEARAQQSEARAQQSEARAQQSEARAQQSEARAQQSEAQAQQSEARAQQSEILSKQIEAKIIAFQEREQSIYSSKSWRITSPLRWCSRQSKNFFAHTIFHFKSTPKKIVRRSIHFASNNRSVLSFMKYFFNKIGLYEYARSFYWKLSSKQPTSVSATKTLSDDLSPRTHKIYSAILKKIEKSKGAA